MAKGFLPRDKKLNAYSRDLRKNATPQEIISGLII